MKKVLLVLLSPYINDSRVSKIAQSLSENKYEVVIKAVHNGDEKLETNFFEGNVRVERVVLKTKKWPKAFQFIKYIEFMGKISKENYDIIHCNDFGPLPFSIFYKKFINKSVKIVYDAHEYQSETVGISIFLSKVIKFLEKLFFKQVDLFITVSKGILDEYKSRYDIKNSIILYNTPKRREIISTQKLREFFKITNTKPIILFQGYLTNGRGIEKLLDLFFNNEKNKSFELVFMGNGQLSNLVKQYTHHPNIHYLPAVEREVLHEYTSSADIGIIPYENTCLNHFYCMPNKLFEYTQSGLPVIVNNLNDLSEIVTENKIGWVFDINDPKSFDDLLTNILIEYKSLESNIEEFNKKYNWQNEEVKLITKYEELFR